MSQHGRYPSMQSHQAGSYSSSVSSNMNDRRPSASGPQLPSIHQQEWSADALRFPPHSNSQGNDTYRRPSQNLASVHSILNPDNAESRGRRRSAAEMEEESPLVSPTTAGPPRHERSPPNGLNGVHNRRILTPVSPSVHRSASLGQMRTETTPSSYALPQSRGPPPPHPNMAPQLPPIQHGAGHRQSFSGAPHPPTPPLQEAPRRSSLSVLPPSGISSPSYSNYTDSGQASPTMPYPTSSTGTPLGPYSVSHSPSMGPTNGVHPSMHQAVPPPRDAIPVISTSSSVYEVMMIPSGAGPVSLPVEVHVASRIADEKRKRNAGASARFRQRRKEKERESTNTIGKLQRELRESLDDCEYYRAERDRYIEVLKEYPGWEKHLPRSPSPPTKRRARPPLPLGTPIPVTAVSSPSTRSSEQSSEPEKRPIYPRPLQAQQQPVQQTGGAMLPAAAPQPQQHSQQVQHMQQQQQPQQPQQQQYQQYPQYSQGQSTSPPNQFSPTTSGPPPQHHRHHLPMMETRPPQNVQAYQRPWPGHQGRG